RRAGRVRGRGLRQPAAPRRDPRRRRAALPRVRRPHRVLTARAPAISVVIPVYNEADAMVPLVRELGEVLDGIGRSSEIVAVDDGSTDGTFDRLVSLCASERRLRIVRLARNYGQTAALAA